jgi:hypothetical protein
VAQVSKRFFALTDTYGIEVAEGQDDILIIASAVVIDLCCHQKDRLRPVGIPRRAAAHDVKCSFPCKK